MKEKFKVVIFLENMTNDFPVLHYIKGDENIKNMTLKMFLRNMSVSFDNLLSYFLENNLKNNWEKKLYSMSLEMLEKYGHPKSAYEFFLSYCNKKIIDIFLTMNDGGCSEGSVTFESIEMTEEEFSNPIGEIMSPYAFEGLGEREEPKRDRYAFYHPITNKLITKL